jgi:hypothetical protein
MSEILVNPSATVDSAIDAVLARARVAYSAEHAERVARAVTFVNASAKIGERLKMVQRALDVALLLLDIEVDEATVVAAVHLAMRSSGWCVDWHAQARLRRCPGDPTTQPRRNHCAKCCWRWLMMFASF